MTDDDQHLPDVPSSSEEVPAGRIEPPHAAKFQFLFGALAAVALVAVAIAGLALATGGSSGGEETSAWSTWKPDDDDVSTGAAQIAAHVGPRYRVAGGTQLVDVDGGPLTYDDPLSGGAVPLKVAVRQAPADGGKIVVPTGDGVLYRLCGLGKECAILQGKPSPSRQALLNREALELALYSFRYLDDVDQVVVFLPPITEFSDKTHKRTKVMQDQALHFERADLAGQLAQPVTASLGTEVPTDRSAKSSTGADLVARLSADNLFAFRLQPANNQAEIFVVLEPLAAALKAATPPAGVVTQK